MASFELRAFGGLHLREVAGGKEPLSGQRFALALLTCLACAGSAGVTRDRLMLLFWPESDARRARGSLKQLVHSVRRRLGRPDVILGETALTLNEEVVASDVGRFFHASMRRDHRGMVEAYAGPFLDGVHLDGADEFERWATEQRALFERRFGDALEALARAAEERGEMVDAAGWLRRRLDLDPLNARITVALMRATAAAGDLPGALALGRRHDRLQAEQGEAGPDPAVRAFSRRLVDGPHDVEPAPGAPIRLPVPLQMARGTFRTLMLGAALALAAALTLANVVRDRAETFLQSDRVAVAVFRNQTGDPSLDPLQVLVSDWVTQGLARTPHVNGFELGGLYLRGYDPDGAPADPIEMARANGAGVVVAGDFHQTGDSLWFVVQLIDVARGTVLRALDPIGGPKATPLRIINEVQERTISALGTLLDPRGSILATRTTLPPRFDAYVEFVRGQDLYWHGDWAAALPYFRRAAELDPDFTTALVFLGVAGVGTAQCGLADSVAEALAKRPEPVPEVDRVTAQISVARCRGDHPEHNRLQRIRAGLMPGSKMVQLTMSTGFRQLKRPAEALAILAGIDPVRDLGWLPESGRSFYWREVAASRHALGEYEVERQLADAMAASHASPLATAWIRARSLAADGMLDSIDASARAIEEAGPDPALLSGITGSLDPLSLATPGFFLLMLAMELDAHGAPEHGRSMGERSVSWYRAQEAAGTPPSPTARFAFARALDFTGQGTEALEILTRLVSEDTASVDFRGLLGAVAAELGEEVTAARAVTWLEIRPPMFPPGLARFYVAAIAARSGESDRAMDLIETLPFGAHPHDFLWFHIDPVLANLRSNPRFTRWLVPGG